MKPGLMQRTPRIKIDHGLKLDPQLTPDRLAAELAAATQDMTGADIAYLCQRAAMFCVKDAARSTDQVQTDIAIARHHFDAALSLMTEAHATDARPESPRMLLAG